MTCGQRKTFPCAICKQRVWHDHLADTEPMPVEDEQTGDRTDRVTYVRIWVPNQAHRNLYLHDAPVQERVEVKERKRGGR